MRMPLGDRNTLQILTIFVVVCGSELLAKSDGEPVENLSHGHETDSKAKSTDAPKARDEIQPGHLWRPFKFWNNKVQVLLVSIKRRHGKKYVYLQKSAARCRLAD